MFSRRTRNKSSRTSSCLCSLVVSCWAIPPVYRAGLCFNYCRSPSTCTSATVCQLIVRKHLLFVPTLSFTLFRFLWHHTFPALFSIVSGLACHFASAVAIHNCHFGKASPFVCLIDKFIHSNYFFVFLVASTRCGQSGGKRKERRLKIFWPKSKWTDCVDSNVGPH